MTATLSRRVAELEAAQPPPPPDDGDDDGGVEGYWERHWAAAPEAVQLYYRATDEAFAVRYGRPTQEVAKEDPEALLTFGREWFPHVDSIALCIDIALDRGAVVTLRQCQREALTAAMQRLSFHIVGSTPGLAHGPDADELTARRMLGIDYRRIGQRPDPARPTGSDCYYDRTGETFVRQWRATGTRDPETLAVLGFGAPELALLDADDEPR